MVSAACLTLSCASARFVTFLPEALPDISSWEKSHARAEFAGPRRTVEYELYVDPQRPAVYSVTRYRITYAEAAEQRASGQPEAEVLQWDKDGRDVRRFVCSPRGIPRPAGPCRWREMVKGGSEYQAVMPALLKIYSLHASLLRSRDDEAAATP